MHVQILQHTWAHLILSRKHKKLLLNGRCVYRSFKFFFPFRQRNLSRRRVCHGQNLRVLAYCIRNKVWNIIEWKSLVFFIFHARNRRQLMTRKKIKRKEERKLAEACGNSLAVGFQCCLVFTRYYSVAFWTEMDQPLWLCFSSASLIHLKVSLLHCASIACTLFMYVFIYLFFKD